MRATPSAPRMINATGRLPSCVARNVWPSSPWPCPHPFGFRFPVQYWDAGAVTGARLLTVVPTV